MLRAPFRLLAPLLLASAGLSALAFPAPVHAADSRDTDAATALAGRVPDAAALMAERDKLQAAKKNREAIAPARKLVEKVAALPDATLKERAIAADYLARTLLVANLFDEAYGWSLHAAALWNGQASPPAPDALASDKRAAAALVGNLTLDIKHIDTFYQLQVTSLVAYTARRPDLAQPVLDKLADAAPVILGKSKPTSTIANRAGTTDIELGQGQKAETRLRLAFDYSSASYGEAAPQTQLVLSNLAAALALQGRSDEALVLARRAYEGVAAAPGTSAERQKTIINLGQILADRGEFAEAGRLAQEVLTLAAGKPSTMQIDAYVLAGRVALAQGKGGDAITQFEYAIATAAAARGSFAYRMRPALYMAMSMIDQDRWLAGQKYMLGAATLLYSVDKDVDSDKLTSSKDSWTKRLASYSAEFNRGASSEDIALYDELLLRFSIHYEEEPGANLPRARRLASEVNARIDQLGFLPQDEIAARNAALAARRRNLLLADYDWFSAPSMKMRESLLAMRAESFTALQRADASSASQAIAQLAARTLSEAISPELGALARRREELVAKWSELDRARLLAVGGGPVDPGLAAQISAVEAELAQIDGKLRAAAPQFFAYIRPEPMSEAEAKRLIGPDEAAMLVVPSEAGTHIMLVTDQDVNWLHSDLSEKEIEKYARRLLWFAGAGVEVSEAEAVQWADEVPGDSSFDRTTAHILWRELVEPALPYLKDRKRLYIAADGILSSLPFGILVSAPPEGKDDDPDALRGTRWLADDYALTQIPSLQSLALLRSAEKGQVGTGFSGWGDPMLAGAAETRGGRGRAGTGMARVFGATRSASGAGLANIAELKKLARLPGTATELNAMARAFAAPKNALHLDRAATETALKQADLSKAGIIAFATHGLTAGEVSGAVEPGLVMTPPTEPGAMDDGYLAASEVAQLKLAADWVILSACNTAAGDGSAGAPGLSGLARAFFYAGARNLLVSHWPVRDDVAAKLTVRTIEIARDNPDLSRPEALQQAMREIRKNTAHPDWAHPNAWAPFTLIGDGRPRG